MRPLLVSCGVALSALLALNALADTIYKSRDAQGRIIYSDQPQPGAVEQRQLPSINTMEPSDPQAYPPQLVRDSEPAAIDYDVRIDAPASETSVPPGQRDLTITVSLEPQLAPGHSLAYYQNDALLLETRQKQLIIEEIFRGAHTLEVAVINEEGDVLSRSEPVVVYVHRVGLNSPARR